MKIVFLIDTVNRDKGLALDVKSKMESNNLGIVDILSIYPVDGDGFFTYWKYIFNRYDYIITPSYNTERTASIRLRTILSGAKLIEFTSEQFYSPDFEIEKLNKGYESKYRKHVYQNFVWGEYYASKIVCSGMSSSDRTWIVGSPKINKMKKIKPALGIAFVSDFSLADFDGEDLKTFNKNYRCHLSNNDIEVVTRERERFISLAIQLAEKSDKQVYIRPHPGESTQPYLKAMKSGVIISNPSDESFCDFIINKECAVIYTSTSFFEMISMGIPVLSTKAEELPNYLKRDYYKDLVDFKSSEEVLTLILSGDYSFNLKKECLKRYIDNYDASYEASDALLSALISIKKIDSNTFFKMYLLKSFGVFFGFFLYPKIFFYDLMKYLATFFIKNKFFRGILIKKYKDKIERFEDPSHSLKKEDINYNNKVKCIDFSLVDFESDCFAKKVFFHDDPK